MLIKILYQYANFISFILIMFFAGLQLIQKNKLIINYYLSGLFFSVGYNFFYYWLLSKGFLKHLPLLINTEICFGFLIGPFSFFYLLALSGARRYKPVYFLPHLVPFIILFVLIVILNQIDSTYFLNYVNNSILPNYSHNKYIGIINTFCDASMAIYFFLNLINISIFLKLIKFDIGIVIMFIFFILLLINTIIMIIANIFNNITLLTINIVYFGVATVYYSLFLIRYPDFALSIIRKGRTLRYKKSILKKYDSAIIENRLLQLMEEEKFFIKPDLTLQSLSAALLIKPYELSHILNKRFNENFNTFINQYRINEAKKQLLENPGKSILEITFAVGFNNTSSFYDYFTRYTKVSPVEYRNKSSESSIPDKKSKK